MTRTYYTLAIRDNANTDWTIEFGDYYRETVEQELDDLIHYQDLRRADCKIVRHRADDQASIDADYAALNGRNPDLTIVGNI